MREGFAKENLVQYWVKTSIALGVTLTLSGCSIFTNDAHHPRNYRANGPMKVPSTLKTPAIDADFKMDVAQYKSQAEPMGYRPPQQVLTTAQGTWIEEGDRISRVYFDKNDGITDLAQSIWQSIESTLNHNQTSTQSAERSSGTLESGWMALIQPKDGWFWEDETVPSQQRFKYTITQQEHKRTASLSVELVDYRSDDVPLTEMLKQQLEVRALNDVITEYDFQYRQLLAELRRSEGQLAIDAGFDEAGNAALVLSTAYEQVFDRVASMLEGLSFVVDKVNNDEALINVTYQKPEDSVWNSIWGSDTPSLPLQSGKYTIKIAATKSGGSVMTWLDGKGNVLDAATIQSLQQGLLDAMHQKDVIL
ncbi:Outer membrane protein NlpB, lipoprotein component of the protein assembly complex (forms a complex with YaeT, YfiO, and YfgL); Lipoprotein-34 precursor [Pseudoalteromonas luteoviolacea B = ATCC 29581]|nr:Outer membrane protein NlpB, lipoprotein component of the protein assembly complex (forms a complex with YaeT, YfiO, and YfgL); Lipoprotein-34 precursor [Pseudoalteromonas luteoviolacea B = ATCC 29581]